MNTLNFLVKWGEVREKSWSGTNFSLFKALSKYYDVRDYDLKLPFLLLVLFRVLRLDAIQREVWSNRYYRLRYRKSNGKVFQFAEIKKDNKDVQTYIYQDLSVSYVSDMSHNKPDIFKVSAFQNNNIKSIDYRKKIQNDYYQNCAGIFTMGKWLKEYLIKSGIPETKVHHVGGGTNINPALINPTNKQNNKICFVGRDFERKGGYITYEAFKLLREEGMDVELYVSGPKQNPIENPIEGYHYLGDLSYDEVGQLYNKCDIFCMPSYFEAYGLVFVEALIFGLPCIGRNCCEMPYFIEDGETGLLLNNDDPKELATLMKKLLSDERIKENVRSRRDFYLQEYSWDSVAKRIASVIE